MLNAGGSERIRVLHILEATLGGTRRYIENIAEALDRQHFYCGLIYSTQRCDEQFSRFLVRAHEMGWNLYEVSMIRSIHPSKDCRDILKIQNIIHSFQPHIVHCHSAKAGGLGRLAVFLMRGMRPKVVYTPNALPTHLGWQYGILELLLARITDRFIAISASEAREISRLCLVPLTRVSVVWPFIDTDHFVPIDKQEARRTIGLSDQRPLILGVGRLSHQKDPVTFVKVVEKLYNDSLDIRGIWVGDGELRVQIENMIKRKGLDKIVTVVGWQSDVRPFIASADVVLMPSRYESFGYVAAEALAMARPVVGTKVTGLVDIIPDPKLLFEVGDWYAAVRILEGLLEHPEMALSIGEVGRKLVCERFTVSSMARSLSGTYRSIVDCV